jgi:drug/metabolite transporter (DMT)-like permease
MRLLALFEAIFVVLLWSASPPLVKLAMANLSPLQLAGVRYFGASLVLLPLLLWKSRRIVRSLSLGSWMRLILMGILAYPIGNGLLFWGLETLPATTSSFLLSAIPIYTLVAGFFWLKERPNRWQGVGFVLALIGGVIFFGMRIESRDALAVVASLLGGISLSMFGLMARDFVRKGEVDSTVLTMVPMFVGGGLLMLIAPVHVIPPLPEVGIVAWLAVVNSAVAYMLWNHALKRLQAFEISIVGNLMPLGTAIIAPMMLGESVPGRAWLGMTVALAGVMLVGIAGSRPAALTAEGVNVSMDPVDAQSGANDS